jgi:Mg-chelatase subunit ChlI
MSSETATSQASSFPNGYVAFYRDLEALIDRHDALPVVLINAALHQAIFSHCFRLSLEELAGDAVFVEGSEEPETYAPEDELTT